MLQELRILAADAKTYFDSSETASALLRSQLAEKEKIVAELTNTKTALMRVQAELDRSQEGLAASAAERDRLEQTAKALQATLSEHVQKLQDAEKLAASATSALQSAALAEAEAAKLRAELDASRTTEAKAVADLVSARAAASRETSRHEEAERGSAAEASFARTAAAKDREARAEAEAACRAAMAAQAAAETAAATRLERVESLEAELARREAELKGASDAVDELRARVAQLEMDRDTPRTPSAEHQDAARLAQAYMAERDEARTKLVIEQQIHLGVIAALKGNLDAAEARSKRHAEDSAAVSASLVAANEAAAQAALARETLEAQVAEAQRAIASLEVTLASANARADANESAAKAANEDLAKLQHAATQTARDRDTVSVQAESMLQALREQLAKVEEKWAEATKDQSKWRNEVLFMEGRISRAQAELEDVRAAYNESSARLRAEHAGLQQLYASNVGDVEELDRIIKAFRCPCLGHGGSAAFARPSEFVLLVRQHAADVREAAKAAAAAAAAPVAFPLIPEAASAEKSTAAAFPPAHAAASAAFYFPPHATVATVSDKSVPAAGGPTPFDLPSSAPAPAPHEFPPAAAPAPFDFASIVSPAAVTFAYPPVPSPSAVSPPPSAPAPPRLTASRLRSGPGPLTTLSPPPTAATPAHVVAARAFSMRLSEEKVRGRAQGTSFCHLTLFNFVQRCLYPSTVALMQVALAETIYGNCNAMGLHPSVDLCVVIARSHDSVHTAMEAIVDRLLGHDDAVAAAAAAAPAPGGAAASAPPGVE